MIGESQDSILATDLPNGADNEGVTEGMSTAGATTAVDVDTNK